MHIPAPLRPLSVLALLSLAGCPGGSSSGTDSKGETGDLPDVGDLVIEETSKPTVFKVTWTTDFPSDAHIEYGKDETYGRIMEIPTSADGLTHSGLMAGLGAGQTWTIKAVSIGQDDSSSWNSDPVEVDVPSAPAELPGFSVTVPDATGMLDGFYLLTHSLENNAWVSMIDNYGNVVWWGQGDADGQICEAWMSGDGQFIYWLDMGSTPSIHQESIDGSVVNDFSIEGLHHDFYLKPDGGFVAIQSDFRDYNGVEIEGDALVSINADGEVDGTIWSSWDSWIPADGTVAEGDGAEWTHMNSVWLDEATNQYILSFRNLNSVAGVDADGAGLQWVAGEVFADYTFDGVGENFHAQHGVRKTADGIIMFNNRDYSDGAHELWSEAVEYTLDETTMTYTRKWSYDAGQLVFSPALGNTDVLNFGEHLVGFGGAGRMVRLSGTDDVVLQVDGDLGSAFGYVHWVAGLGGATR